MEPLKAVKLDQGECSKMLSTVLHEASSMSLNKQSQQIM